MQLGFIWFCCEEKMNKGKDLEKKNNVVKGLKLWEAGHWKKWKTEREKMRRVKNRERRGDEKSATVWD